MGILYRNSYVFIVDEKHEPHFVMNRYFASLGCAYRSNIYLPTRSYCVLDSICTDEIEREGEYLPCTGREDWEGFFRDGASENVAAILYAAGLAGIPVSKVVYFETEHVRSGICEADGFVATPEGVTEIEPEFIMATATLAEVVTDDAALQYEIMERCIFEEMSD